MAGKESKSSGNSKFGNASPPSGEQSTENAYLPERVNTEWRITVDSLEYVILLLDKSGCIIRGNRTVEKWGLNRVTKIQGLSLSQLLHPDCTNKSCYLRHTWNSALADLTRKKLFKFEVNDETLDRHLRYRFHPVLEYSDSGDRRSLPYAVLVIIDISREKNIREQLYEYSMELKAIFSALNDQCVRLDEEGIIVNCDGYSGIPGLNHKSIGARAESMMPESCKAKCVAALEECQRTSSVVMVESNIDTEQGTEIFQLIFLPVLHRNIIVIIKNQTEQRRLESIAQQIEMMNGLGMVFSTLRHEIGNPMNTIKMTATVLMQNIDTFSKEKISEYIERVLSELNRVEFLLKNLKSFSMWEDCRMEKLAFKPFFKNFTDLLRDDLKKENIRLRVSIQPSIVSIYSNPRALHQVMINIINNAKDALKQKQAPFISIEAKKKAGRIYIVIRDNGSGISAENMKKIFNPFFTTKQNGTGLGLLITRKILSKLDGTLDIQNQRPEGTRVTINLPEK